MARSSKDAASMLKPMFPRLRHSGEGYYEVSARAKLVMSRTENGFIALELIAVDFLLSFRASTWLNGCKVVDSAYAGNACFSTVSDPIDHGLAAGEPELVCDVVLDLTIMPDGQLLGFVEADHKPVLKLEASLLDSNGDAVTCSADVSIAGEK